MKPQRKTNGQTMVIARQLEKKSNVYYKHKHTQLYTYRKIVTHTHILAHYTLKLSFIHIYGFKVS